MMLFALILIGSPQAQIECPNWMPGSDIRLPPRVAYNYTRAERLENALKCYCAVVAPLERECKKSHAPADCRARTLTWVRENFGPPLPPRAERGNGRNVIINVHAR